METIVGYKKLRKYILENGKVSVNARGENLFVGPIIFENNNNLLSANLKKKIFYELQDFIKQTPYKNIYNKEWWINDEQLYLDYLDLFKHYYQVLKRLEKQSRNVVLSAPKSCISYLNFYYTKDKGKTVLNLLAVQRSCDVDFGLLGDNYLLELLLKNTCKIINKVKIGKVTHIITNAHIYKNNLNGKKVVNRKNIWI